MNKKYIFISSLLIIIYIFFAQFYIYKNKNLRVAHKGGGLNSINSIKKNLDKFVFFELDLQITADDRVVCYHDDPTLNKFLFHSNYIQNLVNNKEACYDEQLKTLLKKNPNIFIITDFKTDNLYGLAIIKKTFGDLLDRFIPQIYLQSEYKIVQEMGYKKIIFTFYKIPNASNNEISQMLKTMNLFAITMDPARLRKGMAKNLFKNNNFVYVYTVNSLLRFLQYKIIYGADEIYTDTLF